jgi:hypothetical protein
VSRRGVGRDADGRRAARRASLGVLMAMFMLAGALAAGAGAQPSASSADTITLRARVHEGAWQKKLSLKLVKTKLISFTVCAVWDKPASQRFTCAPPRGAQLPAGTTMRLEQRPVARALKRADSPGWGMLASSSTASLGAVVSNTLTGNALGRFRYRVTLRNAAGQVLHTSHVFIVAWHR